jgi:PBSX family phage terminase large subunit
MEKTGTQPLDNQRWERYCHERAAGRTQRQAMLVAYPSRSKWKPETVDSKAARLESDGRVKARLDALKRAAADAATLTRAEVLSGMGETFRKAQASNRAGITQVGVQAVSSIGRTLLDALPAEAPEDAPEMVADFACLVAPPFLAPHRQVARDVGGEWWEFGGRSSGKSSHVSLEVAYGMMRHPERSAYVTMQRQKDMREGVFEQLSWALDALGVRDRWTFRTSPLSITRRETGQVVLFHGMDSADKTKAVKAPSGTYFAYQWFEEADQLSGMPAIRTAEQSTTRGPGPFFRFVTFNPPRSRDSWANAEIARREAAGSEVFRSSYLDMPSEWVPQQLRDDAEALRSVDEESYRHEYLGEPVGYGAEVFARATVREVTDSERRQLERHVYGVDWGFSTDPWVWLMAAYDPATRTLYVLDEMHGHGLSNAETSRMVSDRMARSLVEDDGSVVEDAEPYATVECDGAEPKSVADYREAGIQAVAAPKQGRHNVHNSVRWLQERAAIVIDPRCELAAREIPAYQYAMTGDGEVTGTLPDKDNHSIDALRYACSTLIDERGNV